MQGRTGELRCMPVLPAAGELRVWGLGRPEAVGSLRCTIVAAGELEVAEVERLTACRSGVPSAPAPKSNCLTTVSLLGGALAGEQNLLYCLGQIPASGKKCLHFSNFESFLKIPRIVGKSSAHPVAVFSMLPNPPKCHIRQKSRKSIPSVIKLKIP
jgi:hypothetical protein